MVKTYTAKYTRIDAGYMGQLVEWPEVITEGQDIEDCRSMLRDALREMFLAAAGQGDPRGLKTISQRRLKSQPRRGVRN